MIILGLTGSIGMGKSTLASMLKNLRIPVHESDAAVHELLSPQGAAYKIVSEIFPQAYDKKTKTIDRKKLGEIVFTNDKKRTKLESILHPLVQESQQNFLRKCKKANTKFACLDIPLLFETNTQDRVDYTIVVTAPYFIQRTRVLARPNMTEEKFHAILAHQMPDSEKRQRADYIIHTGIGLARTLKSFKLVLKDIEKKISPKKEDKKAKNNDTRNRPRY